MAFYRKVIKIAAEDSPNVQLYLREKELGRIPTHRRIFPGVISSIEYVRKMALWDEWQICVGIKGEFWKGGEVLMYPPLWLKAAALRALEITEGCQSSGYRRVPSAMGVDPGEGSANTSWALGDNLGLMELISKKTPNTKDIFRTTRDLLNLYQIDPQRCYMDRGGGGYQIACDLREAGYDIRTIGFGDPVIAPHTPGRDTADQLNEERDEKWSYTTQRAWMYWTLRDEMDPTMEELGSKAPWAVPAHTKELKELHRQLGLIPALYTNEGRRSMLPKSKRSPNSKERCLKEILGCSPDEADATVLLMKALLTEPEVVEVGGMAV